MEKPAFIAFVKEGEMNWWYFEDHWKHRQYDMFIWWKGMNLKLFLGHEEFEIKKWLNGEFV